MSAAVRCFAQPAQCRASSGQPQPQQSAQAAIPGPAQRRRQLLVGLGAAALAVGALPATFVPAAQAYPLEIRSIDLPTFETPEIVTQIKARNQKVLDEAENSFQNSDLLRDLKEKSVANRADRKKELADKYCMRQAEMGVGDCGGLRYIPGMTKSGVQVRPEWMDKLGKTLGLVE